MYTVQLFSRLAAGWVTWHYSFSIHRASKHPFSPPAGRWYELSTCPRTTTAFVQIPISQKAFLVRDRRPFATHVLDLAGGLISLIG